MFKKFVSSICAIVLLCGCSGGGGTTTSSSTDVKQTAKTLVQQLNLTDTTSEIEQDRQVMGLFFFDDEIELESSVYIAKDGSADIVGVFKTNNVDNVTECIKAYLQEQKIQMQNYYPDEVFKIDNAVVETSGDIVILVCCDDIELAKDKVNAILNK